MPTKETVKQILSEIEQKLDALNLQSAALTEAVIHQTEQIEVVKATIQRMERGELVEEAVSHTQRIEKRNGFLFTLLNSSNGVKLIQAFVLCFCISVPGCATVIIGQPQILIQTMQVVHHWISAAVGDGETAFEQTPVAPAPTEE